MIIRQPHILRALSNPRSLLGVWSQRRAPQVTRRFDSISTSSKHSTSQSEGDGQESQSSSTNDSENCTDKLSESKSNKTKVNLKGPLPSRPILREEDLEEQFIRGWGPGGQATNKRNNCVSLIHKPTGIRVKVHQTRSQEINRHIARKRLIDKLDQLDNPGQSKLDRKQEKLRRKKAAKARKRKRKEKEKILTVVGNPIVEKKEEDEEDEEYEEDVDEEVGEEGEEEENGRRSSVSTKEKKSSHV